MKDIKVSELCKIFEKAISDGKGDYLVEGDWPEVYFYGYFNELEINHECNVVNLIRFTERYWETEPERWTVSAFRDQLQKCIAEGAGDYRLECESNYRVTHWEINECVKEFCIGDIW